MNVLGSQKRVSESGLTPDIINDSLCQPMVGRVFNTSAMSKPLNALRTSRTHQPACKRACMHSDMCSHFSLPVKSDSDQKPVILRGLQLGQQDIIHDGLAHEKQLVV